MNHFIFVVEGEVAGEFKVPQVKDNYGNFVPAIEKLIAILSSDPKIVVSTTPVPEGYLWNGEEFYAPIE